MIVSFKCRDTAALAKGAKVRRFASFEDVAPRKLRQLEIARCLDDLRIWTDGGAVDVEIVDYH